MTNRKTTIDRALAALYAVKVEITGMWDDDDRAIEAAIQALQKMRNGR